MKSYTNADSNGQMNLDTRLFTNSGRKGVMGDLGNMPKSFAAIGTSIGSLGETGYQLGTNKDVTTNNVLNILQGKLNYAASEANNAPLLNSDNAQVYSGNETPNTYASILKGFNDPISNMIYINTDANTSSSELANTIAHESYHATTNSPNEEASATIVGNNASWQSKLFHLVGSDVNTSNVSSLPKADSEYIDGVRSGGVEPLTVYLHGTGAQNAKADPTLMNSISKTYNEPVDKLVWPGNNSKEARASGANQLNEIISNHEFTPDEQLNIIAHSHGGNVVSDYTNLYTGNKTIDNLILLGTPARSDYTFNKFNNNAFSSNANKVNVYDTGDMVQTHGGTDGYVSGLFGGVSSGRTQPGFTNIPISSGSGLIGSHSNLHTAPVWNNYITPLMNSQSNQ